MSLMHDLRASSHRRCNPLTGEWVLVSPQRLARPWLGRVDPPASAARPTHDAGCYLCPGNTRAGGERNPNYTSTYVFTNDFPALIPASKVDAQAPRPLFQVAPQPGTCRVVCFSPRHDLSLAELSLEEILKVVDTWAEQTAELGREYPWVQVFENKGELMGASNPHPHGQIWASKAVPTLPAVEGHHQAVYLRAHNSSLLVDYAEEEARLAERVVVATDHWLAVVPFWAVWPFETLLLPRVPVACLPELSASQRLDLSRLLKRLLVRYDNLFEVAFPYSFGWHGAPYNGETAGWQLHAHIYPPLLRSAEVRKFLVGYELLAEPQRDLTPEQAAERLRAQPEIRFDQRGAGTL
ncbi:MAG: UDP-glucose--hexose-1-phosphate uridylyltransferase [Chloroflexi bacterium]|nr:UDP-glucose--hexose-1-phosphate uridylyltransferase [Chloroflexota bacterium]